LYKKRQHKASGKVASLEGFDLPSDSEDKLTVLKDKDSTDKK